ncbi:hypothetical protein E2562_031614 [Oryza meyeriana var. granulata]|uniref:Uncharacterized protein n=1 Tax=Oryza meyeriana var. granulata TaxID=110450 RepID=A0A6G1DAE3_9ORYZ|nr:hypothetical protein E2562_031614 [Oryza meyeriana var. granulata]
MLELLNQLDGFSSDERIKLLYLSPHFSLVVRCEEQKKLACGFGEAPLVLWMPSKLIAFSDSDCRLSPHLPNFHRKHEQGGTMAVEKELAASSVAEPTAGYGLLHRCRSRASLL